MIIGTIRPAATGRQSILTRTPALTTLDLEPRARPNSLFKEPSMAQDFSPHQQKIIKRYYNNLDSIQLQRLAQLAGELYLTGGKKLERTWKAVGECLEKLGLAQSRIDHLMQQR